MRTYLGAKLRALTHPRNGLMLEELRLRLVDLYADLAAHTKPECVAEARWLRGHNAPRSGSREWSNAQNGRF
jgi:hypothetical protein